MNQSKLIRFNEGPPVDYTNLHEKLSIIYDVPTNPSERLNSVIADLGKWNNNLLGEIEDKNRYFNDLIIKFDDVRDESKISKLKKEINDLEKGEGELNQEIIGLRLLIEQLTTLNDLKNLKELFKEEIEYDVSLAKKKLRFGKLKKPAKIEKKDTKLIQTLNTELDNCKEDFKKTISKFIKLITSKNEIYDLIHDTAQSDFRLIMEFKIENLLEDDYVELISHSEAETLK